MEVSPQSVAGATFSIVKKGFDPDEVRGYLGQVAQTLSQATDHAASMEQRARQAVARMQEAQQAAAAAAAQSTRSEPVQSKVDDTETISRTLLLAQRTADAVIAEARQDAEALRSSARSESDQAINDAHDYAETILADARAEGRRACDAERAVAETELQQLLARLEFLRDDVHQLDSHVTSQRERLLVASAQLAALAEGGLAAERAPILSAAGDDVVHEEWHASPDEADSGDDEMGWSSDGRSDEVESVTRYNESFTAPDIDDRAPTPAYGHPAERDSAADADAADPETDEIDPVPPMDDFVYDEDITAEVPVIRPDPQRGAMRIFGDDV